jgi:PAS domain S-box-containing protein
MTTKRADTPHAAAALRQGGLRASLRLLLPAAVLLPLAILGMGAAIAWRGAWEQARAEVAHSADAAAEYARSVLDLHRMRAERVNQLLQGLSDAEIRAREPELHAALRAMLGIEGLGGPFRVYVFTRDSRPLLNTDFVPSPTALYADRGYFRAAAAPDAPRVIIGEAALGRANGLLFFPVTVRRAGTGNGLPDGEFDGLINVSVSPESIAAGLARLRGEEDDTASLVRADGSVLARTLVPRRPPPWRQGSDAAVLRRMQAGEERFEQLGASPLDGASRLVAYRRVEGWPVYTAVARDAAAIRTAWLARIAWLLALGLPAVAGLAALAILARREHGSAEAARAELERRVQDRTAELARRTTELAASEGQLRLALEAADLGIWEADLRSGIVTRSPRTAAIVGFRPEDTMATIDDWCDRLHPDDRAAVMASFDTLRDGTADRYRQEYRLRRPDGGWVWVESCARAVERDAAGLPRQVTGTVRDVTDRREAEERRALLAREVDHRAKNVLAVVQAALRLTPRDDPQRYAAAVEGRVAALARAHTLLADQAWNGADLRKILEGEFAAFLDAACRAGGQPQAELSGPPVRVGASAAQSLSLALHELATNAVKHGALATGEGRLRVTWDVVGGPAGSLRLCWREAGGPAVAGEPTRRGFGSRVIAATVRDQLGGQLVQRWLPGGLEVAMQVPMARLLAKGPAPAATTTASLEPAA